MSFFRRRLLPGEQPGGQFPAAPGQGQKEMICMPEIKITVRNKRAHCPETELVSNNSNYRVLWELDEEWTPYEVKTMRLTLPDGSYQDVLFRGLETELPPIPTEGWISLGLFAGDLHSSSCVELPVRGSVLARGGSPAEPDEDLYARIMELANRQDGGVLEQAAIPAYVKQAVRELVQKVDAVRDSESIVFVTISDPHHATLESTGWKSNIEAGNLDACRAIKALSYALPLDFAAFLGDLSFGHRTTSKVQFMAQCEELHRWLDDALRGTPQLWTPGNHDTGEYLAAASGALTDLYGEALLKKYFSDYNSGAVYGDETMGYCYRDFADRKLRVINLNTVEGEVYEGEEAGRALSERQLLWFARTLQSLGSRSDAADWGFVVLGHYPLDWGHTRAAGNVLDAYLRGESVTVGGSSVSFSGGNSAVCYGNFHGHLHNLKAERLYVVPDDVSLSNPPRRRMDALRVCCPSANFYRNNEVGENDRADSNLIEFGETVTYSKTAGCAQDTAFCVNVIRPGEKKIYSFCYGAGYDRTLSWQSEEAVTFGVTCQLTHCSGSNTGLSVEEGASYTNTLTPESGYALSSVSVKMGGTDITASAYSSGVVSIPRVTGSIQITAVATRATSYTNLVSSAIDSSGASLPYQDGYSLSSAGEAAAYGSAYTCTGFIPLPDGSSRHIYRIAGSGITFTAGDEYHRIAWYDASFQKLGMVIAAKRIDSSEYYPSSLDESGTALTMQVTKSDGSVVDNVPASAAYFRVAAGGSGANLIVTLDEAIG